MQLFFTRPWMAGAPIPHMDVRLLIQAILAFRAKAPPFGVQISFPANLCKHHEFHTIRDALKGEGRMLLARI